MLMQFKKWLRQKRELELQKMERIPGFLDPWECPLQLDLVVGTVEGRGDVVVPACKEMADI